MTLRNTGRKILILTLCIAIISAVFYWVVKDDWDYTYIRTEPGTAFGILPVRGDKQDVVEQVIRPEMNQLDWLGFVPVKTQQDTDGVIAASLLDENGNLIYEWRINIYDLQLDELNELKLEPSATDVRGKNLLFRIRLEGKGISLQYGKTVSAGKIEVQALDNDQLTVNGTPYLGKLLYMTQGTNRIGMSWLAIVLGLLIWLVLCLLIILTDLSVARQKNNVFFQLSEVTKRFSYLLKTLVMRDFRIKYQASLLGVLWSFLNPLLTMAVYLFVFSTIFKSNIEHFPAYLLTGIVVFNYFSESTSLGLNSIVSNRALITKVYMPKMIYPLSKVLSSALNLLISFIPMFIVLLVTGVPFHKSMLLLPVAVGFLISFCLGMTLILSTMTVFFRDTQFLWGILITIWNFLTPIFYPETIIPAQYQTLYHLNPLYQIVFFMRSITIGGVSPTPISYVYCCLASFIPLLFGLWIFRRKQDRFVIYL